MASRRIPEERIQRLNEADHRAGTYTLYWMQQSQRAECNHALEFAIQRANRTGRPLVAAFGLTERYPDANLRHFQFMLEGLQETGNALRRRGIPLVVRYGDPAEVILQLAREANEVICDRGYLRHQRDWRRRVADQARRRVWQVESDVVVPVDAASDKPEYAARTLRPKLHRALEPFLEPLTTTPLDRHGLDLDVPGLSLSNLDRVLSRLDIDRSVGPVPDLSGGTTQARMRLKDFLADSFGGYHDRSRIDPDHGSHLGAYLHFGQISPLAVALEVRAAADGHRPQADAFLEELIVRRELACNLVRFHPDYDALHCLPEWAAQTLQDHEDDPRDHHYTATELEQARTHDPVWNAAMLEMIHTGRLHNHLRMYWGKKIIEWTNTTGHAYRVALELNNRYFLDGRDPNSYANVGWLFGLHDRAHQERPIFGKVRFMSAGGLQRKMDTAGYLRRVQARCGVHPEREENA